MKGLLFFLATNLRFSFKALAVNKLRTFLSLLGVTIGIFSIVAVFTVVDSMKNQISSSIESLGDDVLYVQKWPWSFGEDYAWWDYIKRPVPTFKEAEYIAQNVDKADAVGYIVNTSANVSHRGNEIEGAGVVLATQAFDKVRHINIEDGRYFAGSESRGGKNVALIGFDAAIILFNDPYQAVGKSIRIKKHKFTVIGVLEREGTSLLSGSNLDQGIVIPFTSASAFVDVKSPNLNSQIVVKAKKGVTLEALKSELIGVLRGIRRLKPKAKNDFAVNEVTMLSEGFSTFYSIMNIAGWSIGLFSILVGGFGIANIMFVSVHERINIIGLQKAVGAKDYHILGQYLTEAIILCLLGGGAGLFLLFLLSLSITLLSDFDIILSWYNVGFGLSLSAIIGTISGLAPAWMAARMDPVEAIRAA